MSDQEQQSVEHEEKDLTGYRVYKANAAIEAAYSLTVAEHRLLLATFLQIGKKPASDDVMYRVCAADIASMGGIPLCHAYRDLKVAAKRLFDRKITVYDGPNGSSPPAENEFRWIQQAYYKPREGCVEIRLSKPILPYVSALTKRYTIYDIRDALKLNSSYAIRIYEMLSQYRTKRKLTLDLDRLRGCFNLDDGTYPAFKDLRRRVIDPAVKQINENTPMTVSYELLKRGRKVVSVIFHFKDMSEASYTRNVGKKGGDNEEGGKGKSGGEQSQARKKNASPATPEELEAIAYLAQEGYDDLSIERIRRLVEAFGGRCTPLEAAQMKVRKDLALES